MTTNDRLAELTAIGKEAIDRYHAGSLKASWAKVDEGRQFALTLTNAGYDYEAVQAAWSAGYAPVTEPLPMLMGEVLPGNDVLNDLTLRIGELLHDDGDFCGYFPAIKETSVRGRQLTLVLEDGSEYTITVACAKSPRKAEAAR